MKEPEPEPATAGVPAAPVVEQLMMELIPELELARRESMGAEPMAELMDSQWERGNSGF